jgi:hypothetical protein
MPWMSLPRFACARVVSAYEEASRTNCEGEEGGEKRESGG